jgi:hypothetical protein
MHSLEGKLCNGRKIHAPRKTPCEVQQPEVKTRERVVIAGIAQIQEPEQLLVDEEEPEKICGIGRARYAM